MYQTIVTINSVCSLALPRDDFSCPATPPGPSKCAMSLSRKASPTRESEVLAAAALLFAERGYSATSMRDIGERVGLLGGSLYHYIKSKDALFVRVHDAALGDAETRIRAAIAPITDPAERLAVACRTLLEIQLDPSSLTMPLMNDLRAVPVTVRVQLIARRDIFERLFANLVANVSLPAGIDPSLYRIVLLSTLNSAGNWYRPGRLSLDEIARQILRIHSIPTHITI